MPAKAKTVLLPDSGNLVWEQTSRLYCITPFKEIVATTLQDPLPGGPAVATSLACFNLFIRRLS